VPTPVFPPVPPPVPPPAPPPVEPKVKVVLSLLVNEAPEANDVPASDKS